MVISLLLVFLCTGPSLGQGGNGTDNAGSAGATAQAGEAPISSANVSANATEEGVLNLNYIWSFSNIENGPITMVINQEGTDLFGQAKYEPDSGAAWNADVLGTVSGNDVDLTMTAQKDDGMYTTKLSGAYASDTIIGNWTTISGGKKVGSGKFMAMWINPNTASYTAAVVEEAVTATQQTQSSTAASIPNSIEITDSSFSPNSMTVEAGTTVTWINHGSADQEVVASNGKFDSGNISPGGQYQYAFTEAGTFEYYSKTNSAMTGKIIVTDNTKSYFVDVHEYEDKIGPGGDLSGVPPGMGGSGL